MSSRRPRRVKAPRLAKAEEKEGIDKKEKEPDPEEVLCTIPPLTAPEEKLPEGVFDLVNFWLSDSALCLHIQAYDRDPEKFAGELKNAFERKILKKISIPGKARIFASVCYRKNAKLMNVMLAEKNAFGLPEIVKALSLLDAPRLARQLHKKVTKLVARRRLSRKFVKKKTINDLKVRLHNATADFWPGTSVTGALAKRIRAWLHSFTQEELEFFLLNFPPEQWKALADVIHFSPKNFQLDYFQPVLYGSPPPAGSFLTEARNLTRDTLDAALLRCPRLANFYSYIRTQLHDADEKRDAAQKEKLTNIVNMGFSRSEARAGMRAMPAGASVDAIVEWIVEHKAQIAAVAADEGEGEGWLTAAAKAVLAAKAPLETVIWWYHELACPGAEAAVAERLRKSEPLESSHGVRVNYGKLMERLLSLRSQNSILAPLLLPYAQHELADIHFRGADKLRVAVMGDASGSMERAIQSATILASLLSAVLHAELCFFNSEMFLPPIVPRDASQVIQVVETVKAAGSTSMAAALWPFYERKVPLDMIILVSDEGENTNYNGHMFAQLYQKYLQDVCASTKVFLVSFLAVGANGAISKSMDDLKLSFKQFRLDPQLPDTSKFDSILGLISLETADWQKRFDALEDGLANYRIPEPIAQLVWEYALDGK